MTGGYRIAVVGMGCIFPEAPTPEAFWRNILSRRVSATDPPAGRWYLDPHQVYDPHVGLTDKVYSKKACFVNPDDAVLDPADFDIDADLLRQLDPMFHLLLYAGQQALQDARLKPGGHDRAGVIIGNIALPTDTSSALARAFLGRTFEEKVLGYSRDVPQTHPLNRYVAGLPAGVLAKALGLGGGSFALDAACASSLYAVRLAMDELSSGRADMMLTGGLSRPDSLYTQMGFSQLRALSPTGICAPFDENGNGLVVGEGAGIFALKRLDDAMRDGDQIHAVLRATGLSNDVGGRLLAPTSEGQLRAMQQAYDQCGWRPTDVDLIECHATGTPVGDAVEFESLKTLWAQQSDARCVIGSVKSNIGHLLTGAGSAALMKAVLALKNATLPPTANFQHAPESYDMAATPFRILREAEPWAPRAARQPRRAGVSAFGFGGINAHVLVEEWIEKQEESEAPVEIAPLPAVAVVGMDAHFGPYDSLRAFQERVLGSDLHDDAENQGAWWGARESGWFRKEGFNADAFRGWYVRQLSVPLNRFRIPPRELEEMPLQQVLMLATAVNAWEDAGLSDQDNLDAGVFVGLSLDLNTTNYHLRWSIEKMAGDWADELGYDLTDEELRDWTRELQDACAPPLTANRTMGGLGSVVASRIARELRLGGPSFALSSEESSGLRAIAEAVRALQTGQVNKAIAGAVDIAGDVRAVLARHAAGAPFAAGQSHPLDPRSAGATVGEGAGAVVLKRLDDAIRDKDRIYAVIRDMGAATAGGIDVMHPDATAIRTAVERAWADQLETIDMLGYLELNSRGVPAEDAAEAEATGAVFNERLFDIAGKQPEFEHRHRCAVGSAAADVGFAGAASGMASFIKAVLCLHQQIVPPLRETASLRDTLTGEQHYLHRALHPRYWLRNRCEGPRRAGVSSLSADGNCLHLVLEEAPEEQGRQDKVVRLQPLGARHEALFAIEADTAEELLDGLDELRQFVENADNQNIEALARDWWRRVRARRGRARAVTLVARAVGELLDQIDLARHRIAETPEASIGGSASQPAQRFARDRIFYRPEPLGDSGGLAFVFPGSGNHFPEMGRDLFAQWPDVLRRQDGENQYLREQYQPYHFWDQDHAQEVVHDHKALIFGQVSLGTGVSDLLRRLGLRPGAAIGYSLGETASLFSFRAWKARDEMLARIQGSNLFTTQLAGDCEAARKAWHLPKHEAVDWVLGVIDRPMKVAKAALKNRKKVYPLIANTLRESVVGGNRDAVEKLINQLECQFIPLDGVTTVHCEVVREVQDTYRDLHLFDTHPPAGVRFYSGAWGKTYEVTRDNAADSILAQALDGVDFPTVIESAYADGVRFFVEVGPGNSCSRMVGLILNDRPHVARSVCAPGQDAVSLLLRCLAQLVAERVPLDLDALYGHDSHAVGHAAPVTDRRGWLTVETGGKQYVVPGPVYRDQPEQDFEPVEALPAPHASRRGAAADAPALSPVMAQIMQTETAKNEAHEVFLRFSAALTDAMRQNLAYQAQLLEEARAQGVEVHLEPLSPVEWDVPAPAPMPGEIPRALNREQCMEFAIGSIARALGPRYAEADSYPTRVRLPNEPLMLVDRIVRIEGEPCSMEPGRVVTEHDVLRDGWYLDGGRLPICIAVEAGQADLFLSGFLGIDFQTHGRSMYRLLDAEVTFHDELPRPGQVINYDIRIERFFRHGNPWFFHFHFDGTVDGRPLLTMRNGCAGFFTPEELDAGRGVVDSRLDQTAAPGVVPEDAPELVPMGRECYDETQLDALREGNLAACFGPAFADLDTHNPLTIPGGQMRLVHRVTELDPRGGRYGIGLVRAEADIHPDDWFLTCHFVDDMVMPGTLMYECCLHTFRVFLMRMGWIGGAAACCWQPIPEVISRLRCRGQVLQTTKKVTYEVSVKEIGYNPEPYAIGDARMYSDDKAIVDIGDMSIRLTGTTREHLEHLWKNADAIAGQPPPVFADHDKILAFATGKPSEAYGDPYKPFDEGRRIARLPAPPYNFLHRVLTVEGPPWEMRAGTRSVAQYDVQPDDWYFDADRQDRMPFAVLLEAALQNCGWLSAYMGAALTNDKDLKYRNLGGTATQYLPVTRDAGTLTMTANVTAVSASGGMVLHNFDMDVRSDAGLIYKGATYFGFFTEEALAEQVGVRDAVPYTLPQSERQRARAFAYPGEPPYPAPKWNMVDQIDLFVPDGGPQGLGFVRGTKQVDPEEWFFEAHFYQDPVCPGSLGLESFLQLLKVIAAERWGVSPETTFESVALNIEHEWIYRGQILRTAHTVTVEASVTRIDDTERLVVADGLLCVDGLVIYQMRNFAIRVHT